MLPHSVVAMKIANSRGEVVTPSQVNRGVIFVDSELTGLEYLRRYGMEKKCSGPTLGVGSHWLVGGTSARPGYERLSLRRRQGSVRTGWVRPGRVGSGSLWNVPTPIWVGLGLGRVWSASGNSEAPVSNVGYDLLLTENSMYAY